MCAQPCASHLVAVLPAEAPPGTISARRASVAKQGPGCAIWKSPRSARHLRSKHARMQNAGAEGFRNLGRAVRSSRTLADRIADYLRAWPRSPDRRLSALPTTAASALIMRCPTLQLVQGQPSLRGALSASRASSPPCGASSFSPLRERRPYGRCASSWLRPSVWTFLQSLACETTPLLFGLPRIACPKREEYEVVALTKQ